MRLVGQLERLAFAETQHIPQHKVVERFRTRRAPVITERRRAQTRRSAPVAGHVMKLSASGSGPGMMLAMQLLEVFARNQGIDLRGRQRTVPQQQLQGTQIGAAIE